MYKRQVLKHLLAQVKGLKPGLFTHVINNAHIYENQVEGMKLQLTRKDEAYEAVSYTHLHTKTVSVINAPENNPGILNPIKVTIGIKPFLRACL